MSRRALSFLAKLSLLALLAVHLAPLVHAQDDRVRFNDQDLWVNGANVAWINFARDIGPGQTRLELFEEMFREMRDAGGNSFRLWLHTNGASTPEFQGSGTDAVVVGPGEDAIEDLRDILDLAYQYDIALKLCLWSFDMLHTSQYGAAITDRNHALLTQQDRLQAYIDHALVPMVEALRGHPAILAWEIFNEPEGMTGQFGWTQTRVGMQVVQRAVNRMTGAIKRADPDVYVTNGSWSFRASSDAIGGYHNYYRDDRLIAAGGDEDGTLDFYSVHYYEHFGQIQSPFHRDVSFWGLDKPLVIAEFYMSDPRGDGDPDATFGVAWEDLYETLYERGYAGAMGWQWFDWYANRTNLDGVDASLGWPRMLANMRRMAGTYPEEVTLIYPGLRVAFEASRDRIEAGQQVTLAWNVRGADTVTLNDAVVEPVDERTLALNETTTFVLRAVDAEGEAQVRELTVEVVDPEFINRARGTLAVASSSEGDHEEVNNPARDPQAVTDGNMSTRWSSSWRDGEWIYVDLGRVYDVERVILFWENAFGEAYDIDVSFDARTWRTVYEERSGTGGTDEITLAGSPSARYVRMHGLQRATEWGFSLYEFEVYGRIADLQAPVVTLTAPATDQRVDAGADLAITAEVEHDREIEHVAFFANGDSLGVATAAPFTFTWVDVPLGTLTLTAIATDVDGLPGVSEPVTIETEVPRERTRYEINAATLTGTTTLQTDASATGGTYADMRAGSITWSNITVAEAGTYDLVIGYRLAYDTPKSQYIHVNGERIGEVEFSGATNQWLTLEMEVELQSGANTIGIVESWGWMHVNFIEIVGDGQAVSAEDDAAVGSMLALGANYPNPFASTTTIPYTIGSAGHVRLDVFDVAGRRVATLVDGIRQAGEHAVPFEVRDLASGVYLYRLQAEGEVLARRMLIVN